MNTVLAQINNRDIAIFVWTAVFVVVMLSISSVRKSVMPSLLQMVKLIFSAKLLPYFTLMIVYACLLVVGLYRANFWEIGMAKDTLYWFFTSALALAGGVSDAQKNDNFFKETMIRNLRLAVISVYVLKFILNFYVLNVVAELILVPIVTLIVILIIVAGTKAEFAPAKNMLQFIFGVISVIFILFASIQLITNIHNFLTIYNLKSFVLPVILTTLFIPFVYAASIYAAYDGIYMSVQSQGNNSKALARFITWRVAKIAGFSFRRINLFSRHFVLRATAAQNRDDAAVIIADYKSELHSAKH